ncbi:hypothetical protein KKC32_02260 [Patescibacteria group bacterium]|nr:hypothetical protein [Patescibacteria group bacterium]
MQSEGSWIDKSFSLGISFAITSLFLGIMPAIFLLKNQLKFEPAQLAPRTTITFSIQHKLKAMEQETIGELSRFHSLYQELQAMKENSMQDAEFLRERISRHDSRYLKTSLEEAEASISIANAALAKLASFKAKVVEFLQRSLNSVREMEPYLIELEVVERVHANKLRAQELAKEAQIEIIAAVQTLQNKISRVQSEITARFKAIGINLALNAHNSENLVRDLENIERTLEEFAEAQII